MAGVHDHRPAGDHGDRAQATARLQRTAREDEERQRTRGAARFVGISRPHLDESRGGHREEARSAARTDRPAEPRRTDTYQTPAAAGASRSRSYDLAQEYIAILPPDPRLTEETSGKNRYVSKILPPAPLSIKKKPAKPDELGTRATSHGAAGKYATPLPGLDRCPATGTRQDSGDAFEREQKRVIRALVEAETAAASARVRARAAREGRVKVSSKSKSNSWWSRVRAASPPESDVSFACVDARRVERGELRGMIPPPRPPRPEAEGGWI